MKTKYKYIHFVKVYEHPSTDVYDCRADDDTLGTVKWYGPWRQYCFVGDGTGKVIFNSGCLKDLADFLRQLNEAHHGKKARR